MPFGLVFGAVVFAVLGLWAGVRAAVFGQTLAARLGGVILIVLGISLSLGLVKRQSLARWTGVVASALLALVGLANVMQSGRVVDHVVFFGALGTLVLLAVPATGDVRRGIDPAAGPRTQGKALGRTALAALVAFFGFSMWTWFAQENAAVASFANRPRLEWLDYNPGLEKAQSEGKPILVDFYADWCGPCKAMDRRTFRNPDVVERLKEDMVAIRVDSEETEPRNGVSGYDLAERYSVMGYPTLMILDGEGRIISRKSGYQDARQLLSWLDETLAAEIVAEDPDDIGLAL
jgi:thiol-disulfide isomerase/thioredoxin